MKQLLFFIFTLSFWSFATLANEQFNISDFAKIPTLHEGRIKPIDTYSRLTLKEFYGRENFEKQNSNEWLIEVLFDPKNAYERKIFKINNPSALSTLGLESNRKYFNFIEIFKAFSANQEIINSILQVSDDDLDPNNKYLKDLYNRFINFMGLSRSFSFFIKDFSIDGTQYYSYYDLKKINNPNVPKVISEYFAQTEEDSTLKSIYLFQSKENETWSTPWEEMIKSDKNHSELEKWNKLFLAYTGKDKTQFNSIVRELIPATNQLRVKLELLQNNIHFSTWILALYIISFLLIFNYILFNKTFLIEYSVFTLYSGAIIHFFMIFSRTIILSRPPVTNLYESILFVSFTSVIVGIIYFNKTKSNIGLFLSSILGVILLYLSQGYERNGDNMGMIVAVLDTNFWLATHVLTISIGYGCALVMSFMAHYFLLLYNKQSPAENHKLHNNIHLTLLFSLFFTVIGTILGGIWADQSWGRFWGWDPKENGALLICLWLLWIAHAKISRHFRELSYAFFAGLTGIIVILAWFGVNLLNVGLHSYGFSNDTALSIGIFSALEIFILSLLYLKAKFFKPT